jgi:hypothetical protein
MKVLRKMPDRRRSGCNCDTVVLRLFTGLWRRERRVVH